MPSGVFESRSDDRRRVYCKVVYSPSELVRADAAPSSADETRISHQGHGTERSCAEVRTDRTQNTVEERAVGDVDAEGRLQRGWIGFERQGQICRLKNVTAGSSRKTWQKPCYNVIPALHKKLVLLWLYKNATWNYVVLSYLELASTSRNLCNF